jgi:superfamily II DNA or RNA helicase
MPYFIDQKSRFKLEPSDPNSGLRKCQLGAIWALKSHFTVSNNQAAALISMPTGSGKTALMMACCFELALRKLLIVVPSQVLRRQICEQFSNLQILKDEGCLPDNVPSMRVYEAEHRKKNRLEWEAILNHYDVIVAHPNSISPYYSGIAPVPKDLIDAVFIDEAHHSPAPTWKDLNDYYDQNKRIFLTATPFRRDKKRMKAKLVYHYPLSKALDEGIIRPVSFRGLNLGLNTDHNNQMLVHTAWEAFQNERANNPNASILIRTDEINDAIKLKQLYNDAGFNVDVVHSKKKASENSELIRKVINGELDGLVCVGIASEGLDIPTLKVAVLHATPRSIPYTIQFLGRISRQPNNQIGPATLIANLDEVRGEVTRLYKSDEAWNRLIPNVIEQRVLNARYYRSAKATIDDFEMPELNVFFSALVYETNPAFTYKQDFLNHTDSHPGILHVEQQSDNDPLIVITVYDKPIEWTGRNLFIEDQVDLHILYHKRDSNLLFELTTSENSLRFFKDQLIDENLVKQISHGRLYKTLSSFNNRDYIMVGMKNAAMRGSAQPAYKIVMGKGVQGSVRASDGRVFSAGHALLNIGPDEKWGIATKKGRVWAMQRGTVEEFKGWCDRLTTLIVNGGPASTLPGLSFLATSTPISNIDEMPISIIPDEVFFRSQSLLFDIDGAQFRDIVPEFEPVSLDAATNTLLCLMKIDTHSFNVMVNLSSTRMWTIQSPEDITVRIDSGNDNPIIKALEDILNEYPPALFMATGAVVEGRNKVTPNNSIEQLPTRLWATKAWINCDIRSERYDAAAPANALPIINKTVEIILADFDAAQDLIILDDGANEISDVVWIQGVEKAIYFYHCKASSEDNPGCRKKDCDVLFTQGLRSIHWISNSELLIRLNERMRGNSKILHGNPNTFNSYRDDFKINEWSYHVIMVQPGFNHAQVSNRDRAQNNVYELAIPVFERIRSCMAEVEIWCS